MQQKQLSKSAYDDGNNTSQLQHQTQENEMQVNNFNINYDPLMFRHKVPYIADKDFLLNCASLESSFNPKGLAGGMGNKIYSYSNNGRKAKSQTQKGGIQEKGLSKHEKMRLLAAQYNINIQDSESEGDKPLDQTASQMSKITEQPSDNKDPVTLLKKFFKPNQYKSTALDTNFYANRYKKRIQEQAYSSALATEKKRTSHILTKQYKEDDNDYSLPEINRKKSIEGNYSSRKEGQTPRSISSNPAAQTKLNKLNFPQMLNDIERMFDSAKDDELSSENENYIQQQQREIRDRMMVISGNATGFQNQDGLTGDAVLEKKALQLYQKKHEKQQLQAKRELMQAAGGQGEAALSSEHDSQEENNQEHLRNFLTKRISEVNQDRARPESQSFQRANEEGVYQASCLSKVQAVRSVGYQKIEESFRNRVNRLGVDLSFKKALHSKFKQKQIPKEPDPTLNFKKTQLKEQRQKYGGPGQRPNYVKQKLNEIRGPPEKSGRKDRGAQLLGSSQIEHRDIYSAEIPQYLITTHDAEEAALQTHPTELGDYQAQYEMQQQNIPISMNYPHDRQLDERYQRDFDQNDDEQQQLQQQQDEEMQYQLEKQDQDEKHRALQEYFQREDGQSAVSSAAQMQQNQIQYDQEQDAQDNHKQNVVNQPATTYQEEQESQKKLLNQITASYGSIGSQSSAADDAKRGGTQTLGSSLVIQTIGLQKQLNEKNSQTRLSSEKIERVEKSDNQKKSLNVDLPPQIAYVQQNYYTDSEAPFISKRISKQRVVSDVSINSRPNPMGGISGVPTQHEELVNSAPRSTNLIASHSESKLQGPSHITVKTKTLPDSSSPLGPPQLRETAKEQESPFKDAFKDLHSPISMNDAGLEFPLESTYLPTGKFKSKRFERLPRFTIYLNRDDQAEFVKEYTISLSPEFLNYLMNAQGRAAMSNQENSGLNIIKGNNVKKFDPFEKVVLAKGIDNSILTSFRTLKKENNIISDTLKIIHNKFNPGCGSNKNFFFHNIKQNQPYDIGDKKSSIASQATVPVVSSSPNKQRYEKSGSKNEELLGYMSDSAAYHMQNQQFFIPQAQQKDSNQSTIVAVANPIANGKQEIIYLQIQKSQGQSNSSYKNSNIISPTAAGAAVQGKGNEEPKKEQKRNSIELKRVIDDQNNTYQVSAQGQIPMEQKTQGQTQANFQARNDSVTGGADSVISEDNPIVSGKAESKYYNQNFKKGGTGFNQSIESDQMLEAIEERGEKIKIEDVNKSELDMKSPPDINMSPKIHEKGGSIETESRDDTKFQMRQSQETYKENMRRSIASKKSMNNTMSSVVSKQPTERPLVPEIRTAKKDEISSPMKAGTAGEGNRLNADLSAIQSKSSGLRTKSQQKQPKKEFKPNKVNPLDLAFGPMHQQEEPMIDETYYATQISQYKEEKPDVQITPGIQMIDMGASPLVQGYGVPSQPGTAYQQMRSYERNLVSPFGVHHYDEMSRPQTDARQKLGGQFNSTVASKQSSVGKGGGFQFSQHTAGKQTKTKVQQQVQSPTKQFQMGGVLSSQGYNSDAEKLIKQAVRDGKQGENLINQALNNSMIMPVPEHMKPSQSPERANKSMTYNANNNYQFQSGILTGPQQKQKKISQYFDELFNKGKQYVKQYIREDYIEANNCIFSLEKSHIWKQNVKKTSAAKEENSTLSEQVQGFDVKNQDIFVNGFNI